MLIAYYSVTGNVKNFVSRLNMNSIEINPTNPLIEVDENYILVAPSYEEDELVEPIFDFIKHKNNIDYLVGVVGSGNYNFDDLYIVTAKEISQKYNVPLIYDFEFSGTDKDIENLKEELINLGISRTSK